MKIPILDYPTLVLSRESKQLVLKTPFWSWITDFDWISSTKNPY